jgi:hypothetical protein
MSVQTDTDLAYELLPGYGFFSRKGNFTKRIEIGQRLRKIQIYFDGVNPQQYAFPNVILIQPKGPKLRMMAVAESAVLSSDPNGQQDVDVRKALVNERNIKSGEETRPCLTIQLREAVDVEAIELGNRGVRLGKRMRNICVNGYRGGRLVSTHRGFDPADMVREMHKMHEAIGLSVPELRKKPARTAHRAAFVGRLLDQLESGEARGITPRQLAWLLPVFEPEVEKTPETAKLMTYIMAGAIEDQHPLPTANFGPMSKYLDTISGFEEAMAGVNAILSRRLGRETCFSAGRHIIQEQMLLRRKDEFLDGLDVLFPAMEEVGVTPMLAYGSLLGAVRDKGFLPHDDDVDVIYHDGSTSHEEMLARRGDLVEKFKALGFRMGRWKNDNFSLRQGNISLDIFPTWREGNKLYTMRKYPQYEAIALKHVLPTSRIDFYGRSYPAPADAKAFLKWRYGSGWTKSDPYYEWSWPLKDHA